MPTHLWRRAFGLLLPLALLFGAFSSSEHATAGGAHAAGGGARHPYFDDGGTLRWYRSLAEAKCAALAEGKLIFVEYGRLRCSNCKKLAERVLPHPTIRSRMSSIAIGLAVECDQPERAVWAMFKRNLPRARTLPFVAFLTPKGRWITGWAGYKGVSGVSASLRIAEARHASLMTARRRFEQRQSQKARQATKTHRTPAAKRTASEPKPRPAPQPTRVPVSEAPVSEAPAPKTTPRPAEDPANDSCPGGNCAVDPDGMPTFKAPTLLAFKSDPCPPSASAVEKQDRVEQPKRHLATAPTASGNPDAGGTTSFPAPAELQTLPQPAIVANTPKRLARRPIATGDPDGPDRTTPRPTPSSGTTAVAAATAAAAKGDWSTVLQYSRRSSKAEQPVLYALNRQAHGWAHARLAAAARAIGQRRYSEADRALREVKLAMRGEAEAVDAERGAEAIELMRDIEPLAAKSLVRRTVRKTAYERMRGTRWAPLFSPVPQAGAAVAER